VGITVRKSPAIEEKTMTTLAVLVPHFPDEYGFDAPEALVASISDELPDYSVEIRRPPGAGGGPEYWLEVARSLVVYVPWDSLQDAAVELLLTSLGGWLVRQIRRRKQVDEETGNRLQGRHDVLFPHGATTAEKETLLRCTHYRVSVYDDPPSRHGLRAVIEVNETTEEIRVSRYPRNRSGR
jgi:hypothetical protein